MYTSVRVAVLVAGFGPAILCGCRGSDVPVPVASPCQVALPTTLSAEQGAAARANLDAAYVALKGSAGAAAEARSKIAATFATVSDDKVTCAMILRTMNCAVERRDDRVALALKDVMKDACLQVAGSPFQGSWVGSWRTSKQPSDPDFPLNQSGTFELTVDGEGAFSGSIKNQVLVEIAALKGTVAASGRLSGAYVFLPDQNYSLDGKLVEAGAGTLKGTIQIPPDGEAVIMLRKK